MLDVTKVKCSELNAAEQVDIGGGKDLPVDLIWLYEELIDARWLIHKIPHLL